MGTLGATGAKPIGNMLDWMGNDKSNHGYTFVNKTIMKPSQYNERSVALDIVLPISFNVFYIK